MALRLISKTETLEYEGDGFTVMYRRIPGSKRAEILKKHTRKFGAIDTGHATLDMMKFVITDWVGVFQDGRIVGFDPNLIECIPDDILGDIADLAGANVDDGESGPKNSSPTSDSSSITTD